MTKTSEFEKFSSFLTNIHEFTTAEKKLVYSGEMTLDEMDDLQKAIIISLLASLETHAWNCRIAADYRKQFFPLLKRVLDGETLADIVENGSNELRYAAAKLSVAVVGSNDEFGIFTRNVICSIPSLSFKLLCCRRMLSLLSTTRHESCEKCTSKPRTRIPFDSSLGLDLIIRLWSSCLQNGLSPIDSTSTVELLATSCDLVTREITKRRASRVLMDSWSSVYGKPLVDLLGSPNRLIVRHVMELLYAMFANVLQDIWSPNHEATCADIMARDVLSKFRLQETTTALNNAARVESWFGGRIDEESNTDCLDYCLVRLTILLPTMALAILTNSGTPAQSLGHVPNLSIFHVDFADPRLVTSILLEQDDHFCNFFLSCVIIKRRLDECTFDPHTIWLHFLAHVAWEDEVVLDWLASSETVFLSAFVQYLKLTLRDPCSLRRSCLELPVASRSSTKSIDISDNKVSQPDFLVLEVIGNVEATRKIVLKPVRKQQRENEDSTNFSLINVYDKLYLFLHELHMKLERMHKKKLIGFNVQPLLNLLNRVNNTK